jgi:hypothetical protein
MLFGRSSPQKRNTGLFPVNTRCRSRSVSRVLSPGPKAGAMAISLGRRLPAASSDRTRSALPEGNPDGPSSSPKRRQSLFGLAPGGVYQASPVTRGTGELLPRHFTLTPPPRRRNADGTGAVSFLWHFPSRHRDSALRSTLPCGARTFLSSREGPAAIRPTPAHNKYITV